MLFSARHQFLGCLLIVFSISVKVSLGSPTTTTTLATGDDEKLLHRVKRGNYGQRNSGGLGGQGGGGYHTPTQGPHIVFDHIALQAISGGNNNFINSYQARMNALASQAGSFYQQAQQGQHAAAHAGAAANQAGQHYNSIAIGPVSPSYKGEYRKRR